jgi:SAM-dependent methyltransferase
MALYDRSEDHTYLDAEITDRHHRLIIKNLLAAFSLNPGDRVVEVGAGSGRYTQLLVNAGLKVTAIEPDGALADKLARKFIGTDDVSVVKGYPNETGYYGNDVKAVCGFHVLHHIRGQELEDLYRFFANLMAERPSIRGWFFLEPNPFSPLFVLAAITIPGQSFREERGVWQRYPQGRFTMASDFRAACGWLPPRPWVAWFGRLADIGTDLTPRRMFWKSYQVIGARRYREERAREAGLSSAPAKR